MNHLTLRLCEKSPCERKKPRSHGVTELLVHYSHMYSSKTKKALCVLCALWLILLRPCEKYDD